MGRVLDACENTANILYSFACELAVQTVPEHLNPRWALFQIVPEMEHHRAQNHMMQKKIKERQLTSTQHKKRSTNHKMGHS